MADTIFDIIDVTYVTYLPLEELPPVQILASALSNLIRDANLVVTDNTAITTSESLAHSFNLNDTEQTTATATGGTVLHSRLITTSQTFANTSGSLGLGVLLAATSHTAVTTSGTLAVHATVPSPSHTVVSETDGFHISVNLVDTERTIVTTLATLHLVQTSYSLPEDRYEQLGYRPFNSLLIYAFDVTSAADITAFNIPDEGSFLLHPVFSPDVDPAFYAVGGRANYVGTFMDGGYYFRPPTRKEIVWHIKRDSQGRTAPGEFLIFDGTVWKPFQPYAYRGLMAQIQYVANQLDPAGALRYYGQILGAIGAQMGQDNLDLATLTDPESAPARYLPLLADTMSVDISDTDVTEEQRRRIQSAVTLHRNKGTILSSTAAIREAGFLGYVRELWVNPGNGANWTDPNDAPFNIQTLLRQQGIFNEVLASSGEKGSDFIELPHNYLNTDPGPTYFPSSRVNVHINNLNGSPVSVVSQSQVNTLSQRLKSYCLPACVDIRDFVTDFALVSDGASMGDSVVVTTTASPAMFTFIGDLDGRDLLHIAPNGDGTSRLWIEHLDYDLLGQAGDRSGTFPFGTISINGNQWTPVYTGNISDDYTLLFDVTRRILVGSTGYSVVDNNDSNPPTTQVYCDGGGSSQIPSAPAWETIIDMDDNPHGGSVLLQFTATWGAVVPSFPTSIGVWVNITTGSAASYLTGSQGVGTVNGAPYYNLSDVLRGGGVYIAVLSWSGSAWQLVFTSSGGSPYTITFSLGGVITEISAGSYPYVSDTGGGSSNSTCFVSPDVLPSTVTATVAVPGFGTNVQTCTFQLQGEIPSYFWQSGDGQTSIQIYWGVFYGFVSAWEVDIYFDGNYPSGSGVYFYVLFGNPGTVYLGVYPYDRVDTPGYDGATASVGA